MSEEQSWSENESTEVQIEVERFSQMPISESTTNKVESKQAEGIKYTYCKLCGGMIDPEEKKCTKCGKQYFRLTVELLSMLFVIMLVIQCLIIAFLYSKNAELESSYNGVVDALVYSTTEEFGYSSYNFCADEGVYVVKKDDTNEKIGMTAWWPNGGGQVSVAYSSDAARVSFDDSSWEKRTTLTIIPQHEGVTVVTFTFANHTSVGDFKVLIIVE